MEIKSEKIPKNLKEYGKAVPESERENIDEETRKTFEKAYEILTKQRKVSDNIVELYKYLEMCDYLGDENNYGIRVGSEVVDYIEKELSEISPSDEKYLQGRGYWLTENSDEVYNRALQMLKREAKAIQTGRTPYYSLDDLTGSEERDITGGTELQRQYLQEVEEKEEAEEEAQHPVEAEPFYKKWWAGIRNTFSSSDKKEPPKTEAEQKAEKEQQKRFERKKEVAKEITRRTEAEDVDVDWDKLVEKSKRLYKLSKIVAEVRVLSAKLGTEEQEIILPAESIEHIEEFDLDNHPAFSEEPLTESQIKKVKKIKSALKEFSNSEKDSEDWQQLIQVWQENSWLASKSDGKEYNTEKENEDSADLESQEQRESELCTLDNAYKLAYKYLGDHGKDPDDIDLGKIEKEDYENNNNLITHEDVNETFDLEDTEDELKPEDVEIQSTPKELKEKLEKAKETDTQFKLAVRPNLTMQQMVEKTEDKFDQEGWGKPMYNPKKESFYEDEKPNKQANQGKEPQDYDKAELALITTEPIPDSTKSKNYLEQTKQLIEFVQENNLYRGTKEQFDQAVEEFKDKKDEIQTLLNSPDKSITYKGEQVEQWKKAADMLKDLKINQLLRHSTPELLSDMITNLDQTDGDKRMFASDDNGNWVVSWTNSQYDSSYLAFLGAFDSNGAFVRRWYPDNTDNKYFFKVGVSGSFRL